MGEMHQKIRRRQQTLGPQHRVEADRPGVQGRPMLILQAFQGRRVDQLVRSARPSQQHAAFLERFPDRGDAERQCIGVQIIRVRTIVGPYRQLVIGFLHTPAWKHQRAGGEIDGMVAHHHENFDPRRPFAQQQNGGGGSCSGFHDRDPDNCSRSG